MRHRFPCLVASSFVVVLAACSSSSGTGGTGASASAGGAASTAAGGSGAGAGAGAGAAGPGAGGASAGGSPGAGAGPGAGGGPGVGGAAGSDPGGMITSYPATFAPVMVPPGQESTQCIVFQLPNAAPVLVRRFSTMLNDGTHHIILYRAPGEATNLTPKPCQGFSGLLTGAHPIFIAQQKHSELKMPIADDGRPVALNLDATETVRMEMHFINTTQAPISVGGTITMDTLDAAATPDGTWVKSDLAFWGTAQINIPAHAKGDTGVKFQKALPDTQIFALTTHQHHLGTSMKVWYGTGPNDLSKMVANGTNWSDPPLELFSPSLSFPASQNLGLAYECQWQNDGNTAVKFGESVNDEMCFLWHYYYPAVGFQLCIPELGGCQIKSK